MRDNTIRYVRGRSRVQRDEIGLYKKTPTSKCFLWKPQRHLRYVFTPRCITMSSLCFPLLSAASSGYRELHDLWRWWVVDSGGAVMCRKSIPRILWQLPKLTYIRGFCIKVSNIWLHKHNSHYPNTSPRVPAGCSNKKRLITIIGEIKLLCLSTLHQAPPCAWKHTSKSFTNIQTPLSFTIVIPLCRAVFPHFNFIYVVKMKESQFVWLQDPQPGEKRLVHLGHIWYLISFT